MTRIYSVSSNKPVKQENDKTFMDLMRTHFRSYCEKSTIHCVRYLYDEHLHNFERIIWCVLLIVSVTLCCFFYGLLADRYVAQKLETVVEDPKFPVFNVVFPAIAVCPSNRINWSRLDQAKEKFLPQNASAQIVNVFVELVSHMETLRFGDFYYDTADLENHNFEALHFVNITDLAYFLAIQCEDLLIPKTCEWRYTEFNCCDFFIMEKTEFGFCLVFNSELSPRSQEIQKREGTNFYPRHNSRAGQNSGLKFQLLLENKYLRPGSNANEYVDVMIKKPNQITSTLYSMMPNTETYITVRPEITNTDETTRNLPPERRNCLFEDEQVDFGTSDSFEKFNKEFLLTNCLNVCHESYLVRLCNCSLPIFFLDNPKVAHCNASQLRCLSRHNDIFSYDKRLEEDAFFDFTKLGMTCYCMVNCNLMEYYIGMTTLPLLESNIPKNSTNQKIFVVDVHYQIDTIVKYRTSLEFSSMDLIANLGGIFGLCLGASMVSAVELIYYLTVGLFLHLYNNFYFRVLWNEIKLKRRKLIRYLHDDANKRHPQQLSQWKARYPSQHTSNAW